MDSIKSAFFMRSQSQTNAALIHIKRFSKSNYRKVPEGSLNQLNQRKDSINICPISVTDLMPLLTKVIKKQENSKKGIYSLSQIECHVKISAN